MILRFCHILTIVALLSLCTSARAEWRDELRAKLNPEGDIEEVLDTSGVALVDSIGTRYVELTWDGELSLSVDFDPVTDLEDWIVNDGSKVIAFAAYEGRGTFNPGGNKGLRGWIYLDDFGKVRVDLAAGDASVVYEVSSTGLIVDARAGYCKCDDGTTSGCTSNECINAMACPDHVGMKCMYGAAQLSVFHSAFATVTE